MNLQSTALWSLLCGLAVTVGCAANNTASQAKASRTPGAADPDAPAEFSETASGLKYKILRKSEGAKPSRSSTVTVNYRGWLDNGKVFDSSYNRGAPATFGLSQVIPGWTEGLQLVGEGGMIELEIPSELGYGRQGAGGDIPPNATLHFIVELLKVN
jgi:FKBP-type peptidyl-prolyl cis-trans isomerase FkpA